MGFSVAMLSPQIGMPLFVMFLGGIGDTMANGFKYAYSRICCRLVFHSLISVGLNQNLDISDGVESNVSFLSGSQDNL